MRDISKYDKLFWSRLHHVPPTPPGMAAAPERLTCHAWLGPPICASAVDETRYRAAGVRSACPFREACHTACNGFRIEIIQLILA